MTKIIAEIWKGNLEPVARLGADVEKVRELERLKQRNRERLSGMLDDCGRARFEKYNDCVDEYICALCEEAFNEGFCLGTRIAVEALDGAEKIYQRDCCL